MKEIQIPLREYKMLRRVALAAIELTDEMERHGVAPEHAEKELFAAVAALVRGKV